MKHFTAYILLCLSLLTAGCTQNDGHIGELFGSWAMTEYTVDGEEVTFPDGAYTTMSYQSDLVRFKYICTATDDMRNSFGTWQRTAGMITFNFTHHNGGQEPGVGGYRAPEWLGLPALGIFDMDITVKGKHLTLIWVDGGRRHIYKFERTW